MPRTALLCSVLFLLLQPGVAHADITLAGGQQTRFVVAAAPDASAAVQHAADELAADLGQISGVSFPRVNEKPRGPAIYVGRSLFLPPRYAVTRLDALPEEGFVIHTGPDDLFLAGHGDRGTIYAVYTFLEKYLGVRWYAPDATVLPHITTLRIPRIDEQQTPGFAYRDTDEHIVMGSPAWDAHLKLDGVSVPDRPEFGGTNRLFNGDENFYALAPPARYFAEHPEYYSLKDGKRTAAGDSQLCLTNEGVFKVVTQALLDRARNDPKLLVLGLSPNDAGDGNCQCDECRASDARYGSPAGTLLNFVNRVAAAIQAALPGRKIWVETLAYQYTEKAPNPGTIAPAENVLVCLAPIYACDGHPLATDPENKRSNDSLMAWSKVAAGHLQVWHYVTNFANYLQPYPDWDELGADMPYYKQRGVSGMFCEGDYSSEGGELAVMRTWVMAHLFWDPHQDVWKLVKDFCDGYYGPAGSDVYQYLQLYHNRIQQPGVHVRLYDPPTVPYLAPDLLQSATQYLDHALQIAPTPEIRTRVEEVKIGPRYVELTLQKPGGEATPEQKAAFRDKLSRFVDDLRRFKVTYTSEGQGTDAWIASMQKAAS